MDKGIVTGCYWIGDKYSYVPSIQHSLFSLIGYLFFSVCTVVYFIVLTRVRSIDTWDRKSMHNPEGYAIILVLKGGKRKNF